MKLLFLLAFVCSCWASGFAQDRIADLKIGHDLPFSLINSASPEPKKLIFTSTSGFDPYITIKEKGLAFDIVYSGDERKIIQIRTQDPYFKTEDGMGVGREIEVVKEDFFWIWQLEIRAPATKDGWHPVVGHDIEGKERKPNFVERLSPGEKTKVRILGFIKDQYSLSNSRTDSK